MIAQLREKRRQSRIHKIASSSRDTYVAYARQRNLDYTAYSNLHPLRYLLLLCRGAHSLVASHIFKNYILICIIAAGLLVGVQTYPQFENVAVVHWIDDAIIVSFSVEIMLKVLSEGLGPWWFFIGPEWSWNLFDLAIVIVSLPYIDVIGGNNVKLLRLVRLLRLAKVFNRIERLNMIVNGLLCGLKSIFYIIVLLGLCFYIYAIVGILIFRPNDAWHFRSVEISMLTLLGIATLDSWSQSLYINFFGCSVYPGDVYSDTVEGRDPRNALGGILLCQAPLAQPGPATAYYVSFIALSSFCILSLFISSVSAAMTESMIVMKRLSAESRLKRNILRIDSILHNFTSTPPRNRSSAQTRMVLLVEAAFRGDDMEVLQTEKADRSRTPYALYKRLAFFCNDVVSSPQFTWTMTTIILGAAITVGMSTDPALMKRYSAEMDVADSVILSAFVMEIILKIIAECWWPWRYFFDGWNLFDFVVVAGSLAFSGTSNGSLVTVLRLFRILRVLKLMKAVRELQVITSALLNGLSSMLYIIVILAIFLYFFAVVGITFLGDNDPWHFGSLHMAILSLFQVSTMDNWQSVMQTSLYGCLAHPGPYPELCTEQNNNPQFLFTSIYFVFVVLMGGLVLLTLFIGVVSMSMEEANVDARKDAEIKRRARLICDVEQLGQGAQAAYRELFQILDMTHTNMIGKKEMQFALAVAGLTTDQDAVDEIWQKVDRDGSSGIDFAEFLEFMIDLRCQLQSQATASNSTPVIPSDKMKRRRSFNLTGGSGRSESSEAGLKVKKSAADLLSGVSATSRKHHPLQNDFSQQSLAVDALVEVSDEDSNESEDGSLASFHAREGGEDYASVPPERDRPASAEAKVGKDAADVPPRASPRKQGFRPGPTMEAGSSLCGTEKGEAKEERGTLGGKKKKKKERSKKPKAPHLTEEQIKAAAVATEAAAKKEQADEAIQKHYKATLHAYAATRTLVRNGRAHDYLIRPVLRDLAELASSSTADSGDLFTASPFKKLGGVPWPQPVVEEQKTEAPVEMSESGAGMGLGALMRFARGSAKPPSSKLSAPESPQARPSKRKGGLFSLLRGRGGPEVVAAATEAEVEGGVELDRDIGSREFPSPHPHLNSSSGADSSSPKKVVRSLVVGV